ncbi:hypothetical protein NUM_37040 [Actinocatenispora comari]|uniref:Uncharacterized protein n=2 Tax=Actinocatenispora comari TaxID=2807577 RepID=A0A8J4ELR7_9ACTN|nr:hypothetical protein NUM_37040 [Actinocatenispora comari]
MTPAGMLPGRRPRSVGVAPVRLTVAIAATLAATVPAAAVGAGPASAAPTPTATREPAPTAGPARAGSAAASTAAGTIVQLPTGERIRVRRTGGLSRVSRLPGDHTPLSVVTAGGHVYAVPPEATPYLGRGLDLSLFDVAALARRGAAALPVTLSFTGTRRAVPGVHADSATRGELRSPATFGAALRAAIRRDPAGARAAGTPVPGLRRMTLSDVAGAVAEPHFPMHTLTVRLTPPAGSTVLGMAVLVTDADDSRAFSRYVPIGPNADAKISVPAGHYLMVGDVVTANASGGFGAEYVPIAADYAVTGDGQTAALDADDATATAGFTTPDASTLVSVGMDVVTTDGTHEAPPGIAYSYAEEGQVRVQPTPRPAHGVLELDAYEHRTGAGGDDYHLTAEWLRGVPADLHRAPARDEFATVVDTVPADGSAGGVSYGRGPVYPDLRGAEEIDPPVAATRHVDHLYGPADVRWVASVYRTADATTGTGDGMDSVPVRYRAGRRYPVRWFAPALGSGFAAGSPFPRPYAVACRTADQLSLSLAEELDADPDHSGSVSPGDTTGYEHLTVTADGVPVADVADTGSVTATVPAPAHRYRIEQTVRRAALGFTTASTVRSTYTVASAAGAGGPLPAGWSCDAAGADPTVLPLLTLTARLPGTVATGGATAVVTVGHVSGVAAVPATGLTAATSVDGASYRSAPVTALGHGRYRVTLPPAASGTAVSLRLATADAAGSTLTRTVTDAYRVG